MKTLINKKNQAPPTILSQSESNFGSRNEPERER